MPALRFLVLVSITIYIISLASALNVNCENDDNYFSGKSRLFPGRKQGVTIFNPKESAEIIERNDGPLHGSSKEPRRLNLGSSSVQLVNIKSDVDQKVGSSLKSVTSGQTKSDNKYNSYGGNTISPVYVTTTKQPPTYPGTQATNKPGNHYNYYNTPSPTRPPYPPVRPPPPTYGPGPSPPPFIPPPPPTYGPGPGPGSSPPPFIPPPPPTYRPYPSPSPPPFIPPPPPTYRPYPSPSPPPFITPPPPTFPPPQPPTTPFPEFSTSMPNPEPETTFEPIIVFPPSTTTSTTTRRPFMTSTTTTTTRRPFITTTTTTRRPFIPPPVFPTTPFPGPQTTTEAPVIGTEGPDDEDDEPIVPILRPLAGRNPLRFGPDTSRLSSGRKTSAVRHGNGTGRREGGRSLRFQEDANVVTDFVFSDIKCLKTKSKEYFGASIYLKSGFHVPYIRDRPQDPLTNSDCKMERMETMNGYRLHITDFRACGVEMCDGSMCLTLVFPRLPTLALADDEVTTIKCLPQKSSVGEMKTVSFSGGDNVDARRSSSTVEGGKQEFAAEVGVFRQNPGAGNGLFVKRVNSGGVVQIGEPLQLRSVVRGGDGWYHSKLSEVKVWRMRKPTVNIEELNPQDASEVITLVNADGCRNPEYEVIANAHPVRDPRNNLVHHFTFKAFLFRGQRANEPLIVTAKVQACQEPGECDIDECDRSTKSGPIVSSAPSRYRRSPTPIERHNASSVVHDFNSQLSLRVVGLEDDPLGERDQFESGLQTGLSCNEKMAFSAVGSGFITMLLCAIFFSLICFSQSNMRSRKNSSAETNSANNFMDSSTMRSGHYNGRPLPSPPLATDVVDESEARSNTQIYPNQMSVIGPAPGDLKGRTTGKSDEHRSRNRRKEHEKGEDGVYIVYCCNDDKFSSRSAPSSLRSRNKSARSRHFYPGNEDDSDESDLHPMSEKIRNPRTVRSVKRTYKSRGTKIRRRLSSIYREVYFSRNRNAADKRAGSTRAKDNDLMNEKESVRQHKKKHDRARYNDTMSSLGSSDLDSAYSGSGKSNQILLDENRNQLSQPGPTPTPAPRTVRDKPVPMRNASGCNAPISGFNPLLNTKQSESSSKTHRVLVLPATEV